MKRKAEKLYQGMTHIEEELLEEAYAYGRKKTQYWMAWGGAVACVALVALGVYVLPAVTGIRTNPEMPGEESTSPLAALRGESITPGDGVSMTEGSPEGLAAADRESNQNAEKLAADQNEGIGGTGIENLQGDLTKKEMAERTEDGTAQGDLAGRKVMQSDGTDPAIQDAPVDESTYHDAREYSAEIMDLQERISQAMINHELPFVASSAILENPDRVEVEVTTQDEALLEKLREFDKTGELLEIVYQDGQGMRRAESLPLVKNPDYVLKGNDSDGNGGEVLMNEYMTYADFLKMQGPKESVSAEIAKDRLVLVVKVYYPDGFDHVKVGLIQNCLATGLYDAATGEYLGGSFVSQPTYEITNGNTGKRITLKDASQRERMEALLANVNLQKEEAIQSDAEKTVGYLYCIRVLNASGDVSKTITLKGNHVDVDGKSYVVESTEKLVTYLDDLYK